MFAKSTVTMSIVGAFIMACCVSCANVSYSDYMRRVNAEVLEYKHRCYYPYNMFTVKGVHELVETYVQRWYYYAPTKSCLPLYSRKNHTYTIEHPNYNLPRTLEECEGLCGDYCVVNRADGKVELGVCSSLRIDSLSVAENCQSILPETHPKQCPQKYSKCCPRNYDRLANRLNK